MVAVHVRHMGESWCHKSFQVFILQRIGIYVAECQSVAAQHSCHKTNYLNRWHSSTCHLPPNVGICTFSHKTQGKDKQENCRSRGFWVNRASTELSFSDAGTARVFFVKRRLANLPQKLISESSVHSSPFRCRCEAAGIVCWAGPLECEAEGPGTKGGCISFFCYFFWWDPAVLLPLIRLHVTQSPVCFPPGHRGKTEAGREYREAPATSLTLTLPLWSLNLNWLNELPIWEALVTAHWCVHACVYAHLEVCEINYDDRILSVVVCFSFLFFFSFLFPPSASLHFCPSTLSLTIYTKIQ